MSDAELARRAQGGNPDAFVELVHRYQHQLYRLAYRFAGSSDSAEDLCQECLLRAYQNLEKYDSKRPFLPWLLRVASNTFVNQLRASRRHRECEELVEELVDGADVEGLVLAGMLRQRVLAAVDSLPPQTRLLVLMRFVLGLSFREIAEQTGSKLPTVAFRISRGLMKLREVLESEMGSLEK